MSGYLKHDLFPFNCVSALCFCFFEDALQRGPHLCRDLPVIGVLVVSVPFWHKIFPLSSPFATVWQEFRLSDLGDLGFLAVNEK